MVLPFHKQIVDENEMFSHLIYKYHPLKDDNVNYVLDYLREIFWNHPCGTIEKIIIDPSEISFFCFEKKEQQGENQDG